MINDGKSLANKYDQEANATEWIGPEIAFRLASNYVKPGQTILDIGIGTGLGSILFHEMGLKVFGMDVSDEMITACKSKNFATALTQHDLNSVPYPYNEASIDHVVCVGVLNFFYDLYQLFSEVHRILRDNGVFVFVVGSRNSDEKPEIVLGPKYTGSDSTIIMYRHSEEQINRWLIGSALNPVQSQEFIVYMDRTKTAKLLAKAYLAKKKMGI